MKNYTKITEGEYLVSKMVKLSLVRLNSISLEKNSHTPYIDKENLIKYFTGFERNNAPVSPLTEDEEALLIPEITGVTKDDKTFITAKRDYWANLRYPIDKIGIALDASVIYYTEEAAIKGVLCERKVKGDPTSSLVVYGRPVNPLQYILFRMALISPEVCKNDEDIYSSPKISYRLIDEGEIIKQKHSKMAKEKEAIKAYTKIEDDKIIINNIITLFSDKIYQETNKTVKELEAEELETILFELVKKNPSMFLKMYNDEDLPIKALIRSAVLYNVFAVIPGTEILKFNDKILGNSTDEVIAKLRTDRALYTTLTAKMREVYKGTLFDGQIDSTTNELKSNSRKEIQEVVVKSDPEDKKKIDELQARIAEFEAQEKLKENSVTKSVEPEQKSEQKNSSTTSSTTAKK